MALALVATVLFVPSLPKPERKVSLAAPLLALRHRGLLTMGLTALVYNWGFFTMLGYAPYPMKLDAHRLGLVFTGWGLLVAIFSVFVAPRAQARFGTPKSLYANLFALSLVMVAIAAGVHRPTVVIVAVIVSGACIGINNTLTTQAVMLVSPVERPVASSAYGFVRIIGGGLAPYVAGKIADATSLSVPFYIGGATFLLGIIVLSTGHRLLVEAEQPEAAQGSALPQVQFVAGDPSVTRPIIAAVGATTDADAVVAAAADLAGKLEAPVDVVHVRETIVIEELAIDPEPAEAAQRAVTRHLDALRDMHVPAVGHVLHSVGDHAAAGEALAQHAAASQARTIAIGRSPRGRVAQFSAGSLTRTLTDRAPCPVTFIDGEHAPRTLDAETLLEIGASRD
jgi:nucleotide-binding universal stress UspA family protein